MTQDDAITVIWRNQVAAVVIKPALLPTQAPAPHESLESKLAAQFSNSHYIALPHRLDRPVSGVILVAFTKRAARLLGEQFKARRIKKTYLALVEGHVSDQQQTWSDYLRKVDDQAMVERIADELIGNYADSKLAESKMSVIARLDAQTVIELQPVTGRMHQLRVQAASRGHAIVGDVQYGGQNQTSGLLPGAIALQAAKLQFNDPATGKRVAVKAPAPDWLPQRVLLACM